VAGRRHAVAPVAAASGLTTLGTLPVFLLASQSVLVRDDLGFGARSFGLAVGAFFAAAAVAAVLGGPVADRVGPRVSTVLAGALAATGGLGIGLGAADAWSSLLVLMVVLGVANAACQVTANLSMARSVPAHRRGLGFGVKQAAIPLAIVLAGLAVPTVTAVLGWRSTFVASGAAGLLVVLVGLLRRPAVVAGPGPAPVRDTPPLRALLVSMAAIALASAAANALGAFVASWGFEVGLSPSEAGVLMAVGSALNIAARLLAGHLADRRHGRNLPVVAAQMLIGAVALAALSVPVVGVLVPATVVAFAVGWSWPGLMLYAVVRVGRDAPATASGIVQAGAFVGGAAGPLAFGYLVDLTSFPVAWRAASVLFLLAAGLVLVARRMFLADLLARPPHRPFGYGGGRSAPRHAVGDAGPVDGP
jgi:MFS family permease